jgi:hypothetical protein
MKKIVIIALATTSLAACASGGADMASAAFDYAPTSGTNLDTSRDGFELTGSSSWAASMNFQDRLGEPRLDFAYTPVGGQVLVGELEISMPYMRDGVRRFHGESEDGRALSVELQAGPCQDDVSDQTYTYFSTIMIDGSALRGCGTEMASTDRWSNYIADYLPAIDVCLREFSGRAQHVAIAYPVGDETGVRVVDADGRSWECVTREAETRVNALRPLDAADAMYGEGDPIFVRQSIPALGEGCYVYESIREADGTLIGSFGYDACGAGGSDAVG